jgi:MFS family permease
LDSIDNDYIDYNDDDDDDDDINNNTSTTPIKSETSCWDYVTVVRKYPAYRVYLLSHMCQNLGDWFVRIASILIVEELASAASDSNSDNGNGMGKALSYVTLARLLPNAIFAQVGGILADRLDRRHIMISIDIVSGLVVVGYLAAIQYKSLDMFYIVTSFRSALSATYYPATIGIVPLLVHGNPSDLQMAVTMNSWAWGLCAIIGGLLAGSIASVIGLQACYLIDLITYWISATVIAIYIKGNFKVAEDNNTTNNNNNKNKNKNNKNIDDQKENNLSTMAAIAVGGGYQPTSSTTDDETIVMDDGLPSIDENDKNNNNNCNSNPIKKVYGEIRDLFTYLSTCGFGMMIFLKSSARYVTSVARMILVQSFASHTVRYRTTSLGGYFLIIFFFLFFFVRVFYSDEIGTKLFSTYCILTLLLYCHRHHRQYHQSCYNKILKKVSFGVLRTLLVHNSRRYFETMELKTKNFLRYIWGYYFLLSDSDGT